ncbi:putative disease resistance protein At3g14460 [Alnus glutinosa]|uniref:putative disease resistance protein At3g14460 n=1 Tax=Alnus glutinosa TaxID=3517 RepID=UPI002D793D19|nr:putative disease resistance protein At3g14460 [Alnus glutinosa]XP_062174444.1 putative disease resistance protein At3g14460 [Alnus glutinosa]XP_062174445.1 putative disease resistance protein At3g14460 [Alnus glutinosa]XP_062174446.1 putative disease resistance protein At3g14460 [Alnus glutinosa]XP_062174447.1 putative disease resistance protein At3g14460 [Alnus glutinosa]XP_062174449.1 putative disease resistance protein At3g14460 [Alnus glutinosa]XP_062174450.1 putative disease resistanc
MFFGVCKKLKIPCIPVSFCSALCNHLPSFPLIISKQDNNMVETAIAAAGMFISPIVQVFFQRMASGDFVDLFRGRKLDDGLLTRFEIKLLSVNAVLKDAEDKQFTRPDVKVWVDAVYDAVYDAEQVLDEISTKAQQRKLDAEFGNFGSKVRNSISRSTSRFVKKVEKQIEKLLKRLDFLVNEKENLGLREGTVGGNPSERLPTTSLVDESRIFGRDGDKKAIINSLLSDGASGDEMGPGVIAIVGMGGIGKTTLAQLVYNDDRLKGHFEHKAWVCVSDPFNVSMVMRTIIEAVPSRSPCDIKDNLDRLQNELKERLIGKKFLVVLDDIWEKNEDKWEVLRIALKFGAQGSKVIVTTRDHEVAKIMHGKYHPITDLSKNDCLSLFAKYALIPNGNFNAYPQLKEIGSQIIKKCKGLPLAITAIGGLLQSNLCVDEWNKVLRSELWDSPITDTNILPALILSYKYLSLRLRRCFAYCSIFPKDHAFKKDQLVLLWMAEGFLPQPQNITMEEVGDDYFLALVSRSLLQRSKSDEHDEYVMHDFVSDLAKFISKEFTLCHKDDYSCEILSKTCHFSYSSNDFDIKKLEIHESIRLRTIIDLDRLGSHHFIHGVKFSMIRCLRVLILSPWQLCELPDSIGKFKHLRYLRLHNYWIKRLPDSICKLCNLQILDVSDCCGLDALPRDLHKLINLRHLDVAGTKIKEMPINLGKLKCLQTLPSFIASNSGCGIEELGKLTNLRGLLSVLELQNIESPSNAEGRSLRDLKYLKKLVLGWNGDTNASESHKIVLNNLQPHTNLGSLTIKGYGGTSFPYWVGDASFSNIASLRLENCKFSYSLPPLGQLPSLQKLSIVGLDGVVTIDRQFYGSGSHSMKPFGALEYLWFSDMLEWKEWSPFEAENEGRAFPNLRDLTIRDCPKLTSGLPAHLPSLDKLVIYGCPQLVASIPRASSLCELDFSICNTVLLSESLTGIKKLRIGSCPKLELPMHLNYSSLEILELDRCWFLKSFPLFPKLLLLKISRCEYLESLTVGEQHEQDLLLSQIEIWRCPNFAYFPHGGLRTPNLKDFTINDCRSLQSLPEKMHILLPSLEELYIEDCPQVESFPEGGLPSNLNEISIFGCDKLFASRLGWGLQTLPCVRRFSIGDKSEDAESFPDEGLLPTNLTYLFIGNFPNLKYLDTKGLKHLTALEELVITNCPKLERMSEDGLPASLSTRRIHGCPLLKKSWKGKEKNGARLLTSPTNLLAG